MREDAADLSQILDEALGPEEAPAPTAPAPAPRLTPTPGARALRELMEWVSNEVFGPAR